MKKPVLIAILFALHFAGFAQADRGGGSSGGGFEQKPTLYGSDGSTQSVSKYSNNLLLSCPDGTLRTCPTCKEAIYPDGSYNEKMLQDICENINPFPTN